MVLKSMKLSLINNGLVMTRFKHKVLKFELKNENKMLILTWIRLLDINVCLIT